MMKRKLSFNFGVEPVENGVIVTWGLDGKGKRAGDTNDYEHHTIVCIARGDVMDKLLFATSELKKVLIPKLEA